MTKERNPQEATTQAELESWRYKAMKLIDNKRTMVLATSSDNTPWAAPVYYLYTGGAFYFYSSAHSQHTRQALSGKAIAAAIYADGDRLDQIEGLQMTGTVAPVSQAAEKLSVAACYLIKFPLAKSLLGDPGAAKALPSDTNLYRLDPLKVYYLDNGAGFGRRLEITL